MKRELGIFIGGVIVGTVSGFIIERKRKSLVNKIKELEIKLNSMSIKRGSKEMIRDILGKLKLLSKRKSSLTEEEKDIILEDVRRKIKQLEAWNSQNG
jgi:hypothetical protein